jgi:hypothetical protein
MTNRENDGALQGTTRDSGGGGMSSDAHVHDECRWTNALGRLFIPGIDE